jgi:hypothetical protein
MWGCAQHTPTSARTFDTNGDYDLNVQVSNACSSPLTDTHSIAIRELEKVYLSLIRR